MIWKETDIMKSITLLIPTYNEEDSIMLLYERLKKLMDNIKIMSLKYFLLMMVVVIIH